MTSLSICCQNGPAKGMAGLPDSQRALSAPTQTSSGIALRDEPAQRLSIVNETETEVRGIKKALRDAGVSVMRRILSKGPLRFDQYHVDLEYLILCLMGRITAPKLYLRDEYDAEDLEIIMHFLYLLHDLMPWVPPIDLVEIYFAEYTLDVKRILTDPDVWEMVLEETGKVKGWKH